MSWLYSRALVAAYSAANCSDGEPSAQSKTTPTPQAYLWPDKTTGAWNRFPSGMTCEPLTDDLGAELLTWFRADFHAKTSVQPDVVPESKVSDPGCGWKWPGSWGKYDPNTSLWKTPQYSLLGDLELFSETWPRWGTMRDGEFWGRDTLEPHIKETGSGLLPTPDTSNRDNKRATFDRNAPSQSGRSLATFARTYPCKEKMLWPTPTRDDSNGPVHHKKDNQIQMLRRDKRLEAGGQLNPTWVEWLMGWPLEWTALEPLAMDKYQQWQRSHGVCLLKNKEHSP